MRKDKITSKFIFHDLNYLYNNFVLFLCILYEKGILCDDMKWEKEIMK